MNILVFDIETVPDVATGRRLYNAGQLNDHDTAELMFSQRRRETDGNDFLRPHLQRIVAISVLLAASDKLSLWSLGTPESDEAELVRRFFEGIDRYRPQLVSWNGRGFDLPVLHYRALLHGVQASTYFENGAEDQSFRWNNYLSRYHERHCDLMDVLAGYEYRAMARLNDIATLLGLPGKLGMDGSRVWDEYQAGHLPAIRDYCEMDVLTTYLIYLRYQLIRGRLAEKSHAAECQRVADLLQSDGRGHTQEFLKAWKR